MFARIVVLGPSNFGKQMVSNNLATQNDKTHLPHIYMRARIVVAIGVSL
jgi:hypothetical protein